MKRTLTSSAHCSALRAGFAGCALEQKAGAVPWKSPVEWDSGTIFAHASCGNRWEFGRESIRNTFQPGNSHASDIGHWREKACQKASQSLPPAGGKGILIIFCRGVYLTKNTTQAASVRFVRQRRTNRARGRLQSFYEKKRSIASLGKLYFLDAAILCLPHSRQIRIKMPSTNPMILKLEKLRGA